MNTPFFVNSITFVIYVLYTCFRIFNVTYREYKLKINIFIKTVGWNFVSQSSKSKTGV